MLPGYAFGFPIRSEIVKYGIEQLGKVELKSENRRVEKILITNYKAARTLVAFAGANRVRLLCIKDLLLTHHG